MTAAAAPLSDHLCSGVRHARSRAWAINSMLVEHDRGCLICDPAFTCDELAELARVADSLGGATHVLVTHSDGDHICGVGTFPAAEVVAGEATSAAVAAGAAARRVAECAEAWSQAWPGGPRVDRVAAGRIDCAGVSVDVIDASGHLEDGSCFLLRDLGVLLVGDYLCTSFFPWVEHSVADTLATLRRLHKLMETTELDLIVPGHGDLLDQQRARILAEDDIAYLERLQQMAAGAIAAGLEPARAERAVFAVTPPRRLDPAFAGSAIHATNVRLAVAEASTSTMTRQRP